MEAQRDGLTIDFPPFPDDGKFQDTLKDEDFETSKGVKVVSTFDEMGLKEPLLRGIYGFGFEKPSAIQQRAIGQVIKGRDVIAQAQSGTGKTATFSISALQRIDTTSKEPQALILSPTRELASQIQKVVYSLGSFMNVKCHVCIGGTNIGEDTRKLEAGAQIVSGTPGRVFGTPCPLSISIQNSKLIFVMVQT